MNLIDPGKKAPDFSLRDQSGKTHRLSDYAGRPVVLFFYPKDNTPGCTKEACAFQDNLPRFKKGQAAVLGISIQDEASKARFAKKYELSFPLLADADHIARANRIRGYGDFLHYHLLAAGKIDVVIESDVNILDIAALTVIVEAAGGKFTDLEGGRVGLETTSVLATNGKLHAQILSALT